MVREGETLSVKMTFKERWFNWAHKNESTTPSPLPVGEVHFVALQDFFSPTLQSQYIGGMIYTCRPGNVILEKQVRAWLWERKVALCERNGAHMKGA